MTLAASTRLGPYEVLAAIGAGGMGEVYKARDTKLDRQVAIKVLPAALANDPERLARFEREAKVLASLNHPNIAQIYGIEESNEVRALVMELVPGLPIKGPLSEETAINYAKQIAEALEAAHDKGIVHRDLKPANILVTASDVVKVLDFGLAAVIEGPTSGSGNIADSPTLTTSPTRAGMILGTAGYMSPEQARGKTVDKRSDIWSFGAVLYEMVTGRALFQGETVSDILVEVLGKEPQLDPLPPQIRSIVERCLRKDARKRWQAIGDVRIALEEGLPDSAAAASLLEAKGVELRRSFLPWGIAGALFLLAAATSWMAWSTTRSPSASVDPPLMRFDADLGLNAITDATYSATFATISPDGSRLVYTARGPEGKQMLATRLLSQPTGIVLAGTENGFDPFFSPDGQWIGFFADGKMKKTSVSGSAPVTLCDASVPRGASWGEDGTIVAALTNTAGLLRVPASGGTPQPLTQLRAGESTNRWPQVLPRGHSVLFTSSTNLSNYESANIELLDLKTGARTTIQSGGYFGRYLPSGHLLFVHEGVLFAVPVHASDMKPQGGPVPILEDVASVSTSGAGQFDVSRNGIFVYRSGKAGPQIWSLATLENGGQGSSKVLPLLSKPGAYYTPRFSPDGRRLALGIESGNGVDISIYDVQNDTLSRLTFTGQVSFNPVWTPDGKHIAFQTRRGGKNSMSWVRSDGAGDMQTLIDGNLVTPYSISPDSRYLAYYDQSSTSQFQLWILPLDVTDPDHPKPGKPELFAGSRGNEEHPFFSPDGRWIAYSSDESGSFEVYVRPFPETAAGGKWQISSGGGEIPIWSRDGKNLFFETLDNRIAVAGYTVKGDSFVASKPRVWSDKQLYAPTGDQNFDLFGDGARIAAVLPQQSADETRGSVHVTFLLNFFDELRRRAPTAK
jgi:serine/threonine protein kinase/Tol biopolymer transport system component